MTGERVSEECGHDDACRRAQCWVGLTCVFEGEVYKK